MKSQLFKIQVPIATNEPKPMALIYNQSRKRTLFVPMNDSIKTFMKGEFKKYAMAHIDEKTQELVIEKEVPGYHKW